MEVIYQENSEGHTWNMARIDNSNIAIHIIRSFLKSQGFSCKHSKKDILFARYGQNSNATKVLNMVYWFGSAY